MATDSMNPAPNATSSSMTRRARRVTASAPSTLPAAATRAYNNALDTREQVLLGIAGRVLEHLFQQPRERLAHIGTGPHAGGDEIVAFHREVLECQRWIGRADLLDGVRQRSAGSGPQRQQVVSRFAHGRQPTSYRRGILRLGVLVSPPANGAATLDVLVGAL